MNSNQHGIAILGIYVVDLAFRASRLPKMGEILGPSFAMGPGGKGSNQAVAAARAGNGYPSASSRSLDETPSQRSGSAHGKPMEFGRICGPNG